MPRRNSAATKSRTRNRSTTKTMAIRRPDGSVVYVVPITRPNAEGMVTVDMGGLIAEVRAQSLIHI